MRHSTSATLLARRIWAGPTAQDSTALGPSALGPSVLGLAVACLALGFSGCISLDRLMHSTPSAAEAPPEERINIWPVLYQSGDRVEVLWPFFDKDAEGFALRPLIAKQGAKWEILPPIVFLDTEKGDWMFLPAYSLGDSHGLFPIYNRGWVNNAGPIWWDEDAHGRIERGGLFPVALLGPRFNYVGPVWWITEDQTGEPGAESARAFVSGGLFPVTHFRSGPGLNYAALAYWNNDGFGDVRSGGLFPIAHIGPHFSFVGPTFWNKDASGAVESGGVFPIAYFGPHLNYAGPVWWLGDAHGELHTGGLFPVAAFSPDMSYVGPVFWGKDETGALESGGLFPVALFGTELSYVGPWWWARDPEGEPLSSGLFPVAAFSPHFSYVGPAFWSKDEAGEVATGGVFPIAYFGERFSYAGPLWWVDDPEGEMEYGGLFPLATFTPRFNHAGPVYWYRDESGKTRLSGVFPLANFTPEISHVGPVIWFKDRDGHVTQGGLPLVAWFGPEFNHAGPVFWFKNPEGEVEQGGLPLVAWFGPALNHVGPVLWFKNEAGEVEHGGFPLVAWFGPDFSHVGPVYWARDASGAIAHHGLLPLAHFGDDFSFVGPAWWTEDATGELDGGGLFPLVTFTESFRNVGPVIWGNHADGSLRYLIAPPLAVHTSQPDGSSKTFTPLGGAGFDADGNATFVNVLGPIYHYHKTPDGFFMTATPLFTMLESADETRWDVWPLFGRKVERNEAGKPTQVTTSGLGGLIRHTRHVAGTGEDGAAHTDSFRALPLFNYRAEHGGDRDLADWLSLVSYKDKGEAGADMHVLTPLMFNYARDADHTRWHSLLGTLSYESEGDTSEFNFLYYLYRQKTEGTETRRDFFPFVTWDSGEKRSGFSFLWRLFHYERNGDKTGGHVLFIPWGDV